MLRGRNVVLGISAGIAAYKTCELVRLLKKAECGVDVVMTENATHFVTPLTMQTLSQNKVTIGAFEIIGQNEKWDVEHIALAKKADCFVLAPATADLIAKLAAGICDDFLTTTVAATTRPVIVCPAMNSAMYTNPTNLENMRILREKGYIFVDSGSGELACGDVGIGRMAEVAQIFDVILDTIMPRRDFVGKRVLITAGGTREPIDRVRYIGNHSSGKMGAMLARAAFERGADVTMIVAEITAELPRAVTNIVHVQTTSEMYDAVLARVKDNDVIIMAAAPADYRPAQFFDGKLKSENLTLELVKNPDIAAAVGRTKGEARLVVFAAETDNLEQNAIAKLQKKNADLMVANDVTQAGAGFGCDTNIVSLYSRQAKIGDYPMMTKYEVANLILDNIAVL